MPSLSQLSDAQIVMDYQEKHDPVYFGELYDRYFKKVYHYCLGRMKNRNDAYDITTETFLKLMTKIGQLKNPGLFSTWLFKVAANSCIDVYRKRKKNFILDIVNIEVEGDTNCLESIVLKEAQLQKLDAILSTVENKTKNILIKKYCKGKSIKDLEKEMGLSTSAVKMRLSRGKKKIATLWSLKT